MEERDFVGEIRAIEGQGGLCWEDPGVDQGDNQNSSEQSHPKFRGFVVIGGIGFPLRNRRKGIAGMDHKLWYRRVGFRPKSSFWLWSEECRRRHIAESKAL